MLINKSQAREFRAPRIRRAGVALMLGALVACSGETPLAPGSHQELSAQVAPGTNYSYSISAADHTVGVRFTRVRSDGAESVSAFMQRMFAGADSAGATRLVLDLRSVRGGDAFLLVPLVKGVLARERFLQRGSLVVIVGPDSFSPGQNAAAMLQRYANPVFAGAPII